MEALRIVRRIAVGFSDLICRVTLKNQRCGSLCLDLEMSGCGYLAYANLLRDMGTIPMCNYGVECSVGRE